MSFYQDVFYHLRRIRQLRRHVDYDTLYYAHIRSSILFCLDYCNSLSVCSSQMTLCRLRRVHDAAARLLCGVYPLTHAPSLLKRFHWLPVSSGIQFKLDGKYSERVQLPQKRNLFFCRQHLATLATPTTRSIKCKQSPVYGVF